MSKLRNIIKNLFLSLILVWTVSGFAQADKLYRASALLQSKNFDAARLAIDSVIQHPDTKKDYVSWTTRAFIYFELYKRSEKNLFNSPLRDTITSSLKTSYSLKPDADYLANNRKLTFRISAEYFNMAKRLLQDSLNDQKSAFAYLRSKDLIKLAKPDSNFAVADVEYYNTVGGIFSDIFNKDNSNIKAHDAAKVALLKVIEIQPNNARAHYNLGIMYYNQAGNLGKTLDYGADISQIDVIQESIIKLAKQAEQQISIIYKNDNKSVQAIEALYYIYRMLNDIEKAELFKNKCKEFGIKTDN